MRADFRLSVIIPALNEAAGMGEHLKRLQALRGRGHEIIVVDGGSTDGTPQVARNLCDKLLSAPRGRASQMNAGASEAAGDVLLFLHADTRLPERADDYIRRALDERVGWGRFDVTIEGSHFLFTVIAWCMNRRSRLTGIATGDQALFVTRELFQVCGGFPDIALMEDIAFSRVLKTRAFPHCLAARVVTSGRRWERAGVLRTILKMWRLRLAYFLGADPAVLAREYAHEREHA